MVSTETPFGASRNAAPSQASTQVAAGYSNALCEENHRFKRLKINKNRLGCAD
jgi:hypothetical protein